MLSRLLPCALLFLLFGCATNDPPTGADEPPNVVIVLVDDLRFDTLGVSGNPFFQSPCIDRIADEGARFEDAFVITSLCSPSRATILTGLHTPQHGVRDIWTSMYPASETIGTLLQSQGYTTALIGKSHINSDGRPLEGFDRWFSFRAQGSYFDPEIVIDGTTTRMSGHMTDILTDEALRFVGEQTSEKPFLMILSHLAAHTPWTAQPRFEGMHADASIPQPETWNEDFTRKPRFLRCRQLTQYDESKYRRYYDMVAGVEESTCKLLEALESSGMLDNTVLIFTSDNGYMLGEHRLGDKRVAYEESIRVPLFVRYPPRITAGTIVRGNIALNLDIAPTALAAAGLDVSSALPGFALWDLANGSAQRDRFLYLYFQDNRFPGSASSCTPDIYAIRTLDHILVDYSDPGTMLNELYDLRSDPQQRRNQFREPVFSALTDSLKSELAILRKEFAVD